MHAITAYVTRCEALAAQVTALAAEEPAGMRPFELVLEWTGHAPTVLAAPTSVSEYDRKIAAYHYQVRADAARIQPLTSKVLHSVTLRHYDRQWTLPLGPDPVIVPRANLQRRKGQRIDHVINAWKVVGFMNDKMYYTEWAPVTWLRLYLVRPREDEPWCIGAALFRIPGLDRGQLRFPQPMERARCISHAGAFEKDMMAHHGEEIVRAQEAASVLDQCSFANT